MAGTAGSSPAAAGARSDDVDVERVAVRVEGLTVRFGELVAVDDVSFEVAAGEVFGLLGPNGAGKTTMIRVLTSLLKASSGHAQVAGHDVRSESLAVRESIGYVPQAISVDGTLTGRENLQFYAAVTDVPRGERAERIEAAVAAMAIEQQVGKLARTLSGGLLRRLEIATALLNRPAVLFLDEPTVGLDPTARRLVWERLHHLRDAYGTTLLMTTHVMEEAEEHCERVAIMDRGRIVAEGAPAELRQRVGVDSLDDVFTTLTAHPVEEMEGRFRDVRAGRRIARRLG
jgi:ABC-2 type transport system ATP-binding protein